MLRNRLLRAVGTVAASLCLAASGCTVDDALYCSQDADCLQIMGTAGYSCDPIQRDCKATSNKSCSVSAQCTVASLPYCDSSQQMCAACTVGPSGDEACAHLAPLKYCGATATSGTSCVECRNSQDCINQDKPICDGGTCRPCQRHFDCEGQVTCEDGNVCTDSLVCLSDADGTPGRCAKNGNSGRVVYVNNAKTSGCSDVAGQLGTDVKQPFCTLMQAFQIASTTQRSHIRVLPGDVYDPMPTGISSGRYVFIGSPVLSRGLTKPAVIKSKGPTFPTNTTGDVTVEEFDMTELLVATPLITCTGSIGTQPSFTLLNSILHGSSLDGDGPTAAIGLYSCTAHISGNQIGLTSKADTLDSTKTAEYIGIAVTAPIGATQTAVTIENNVIAGMWGVGVSLGTSGNTQLVFRFNTLVGNGRSTKFSGGGLECPGVFGKTVLIADSILDSNGMFGGTSQISDNSRFCQFSNVVTGPKDGSTAMGLDHTAPNLDDSFALTAASTACIDKVQGAPSDLPKIDIRRTARPQGSGWDIGAYELPVK